MKKILVVLLVLAVAGGVFAQEGSWSLSGRVEVGSFINFDDVDAAGEKAITVIGSQYNKPYDGWDNINGTLGLGYTRDALKVNLGFATQGWDSITGGVDYDGENFKLGAASILPQLINGNGNVDRLWGYYTLLNGMVHLETAYNSRDTFWWESDIIGAFGSSPILDAPFTVSGQHAFAKVDHTNFLLANLSLQGLQFGVMLRDLFKDDGSLGNFPGALADNKGSFLVNSEEPNVLEKLVFGLKFDMAPFEIAVQFLMKDYGVYFGGKVDINPVTVGLSFKGILGAEDKTNMRVGADVTYGAGWGGLGLNGIYGLSNDKLTPEAATQIGIEPYFYYNVIPSHLQFRTDIGFYFDGGTDEGGVKIPLKTTWAVQPQLFWNFLGTGAGGYWDWGTGMLFRYRLVSDVVDGPMKKNNALDMTFRYAY